MTDASVLVLILQVGTKSCDANITNLKWVFSDTYFAVQVCYVPPPPDIPSDTPLTESQYIENYTMRKALTFAAEGPYVANDQGVLIPQYEWKNLPVLIILDTSVSNITPAGTTNQDYPDNPSDKIIGGMPNRITTALNQQADIYFLCVWNDVCDRYTDVDNTRSIDHGSSLKWTLQPTSTQAVLYPPATRDLIRSELVTAAVSLSALLNGQIQQGQLLALAFVPNIVNFDIGLATSSSDFTKLNQCAPVISSSTASNSSAIIWFILIVLAVMLVAWALIQIGP